MVCSPETLRNHLRWLSGYTPVRLQAWVADAVAQRPLPAKAFAITFDDGWRDNYEHAFPVLRAAGVPATIFLVSHMVGTQRRFWPNRLMQALSSAGNEALQHPAFEWLRQLAPVRLLQSPARDERSAVVQACKALGDDELEAHLDAVEHELRMPAASRDLLSWDEVREMASSGQVDFGSHTRYHRRLHDGVPLAVVTQELEDSRAHIEAETGCAVELFCYPNGDCGNGVQALVEQSYAAAVTTARGINTPATPRAALQRISLHEESSRTSSDFIAHLSGWL